MHASYRWMSHSRGSALAIGVAPKATPNKNAVAATHWVRRVGIVVLFVDVISGPLVVEVIWVPVRVSGMKLVCWAPISTSGRVVKTEPAMGRGCGAGTSLSQGAAVGPARRGYHWWSHGLSLRVLENRWGHGLSWLIL
jgi:hypothetical protein